jgi:hypothetical protein
MSTGWGVIFQNDVSLMLVRELHRHVTGTLGTCKTMTGKRGDMMTSADAARNNGYHGDVGESRTGRQTNNPDFGEGLFPKQTAS